MKDFMTGREPALGQVSRDRRISLKRLGPLLRLLPAESIGYPTLLAAIHSQDPYVRFSGAMKLVQRQDRESRAIIVDLLTDASPIVRASIARHLDQMSWFTARKMVTIPLADPETRVRESVVYALCRFHEREAFALLTDRLQNEEDDVLAAAAHALRNASNPEAVPVLALALNAQDPDVRVKALEALSVTSSPKTALPVVRMALADPTPAVLEAAILTFLEIQHEDGVDELLAWLESEADIPHPGLRGIFHATNYLKIDMRSGARGDRWLQILRRALQSEAAYMSAIHALAWNRRSDAGEVLLNAYFDAEDALIQAKILHITVSLMSPVADKMLTIATRSAHPIVRSAAEYEQEARRLYGKKVFDEKAVGTGMAHPLKGF